MTFQNFSNYLKTELLKWEFGYDIDNEVNDLYTYFKEYLTVISEDFIKNSTEEDLIKGWIVEFYEGTSKYTHACWLKKKK